MAANTITLNWQDNSNNEDGFNIYMSTDGVTFNYINSVLTGVETYEATGIVEGQQYWFRVAAYIIGEGESAYTQAGPFIIGLPIHTFGYWPKNYWSTYWFIHYWQVFFQTKFINKLRRISRNRKTL